MRADRYLKIILTLIAFELLWIGARDTAGPVAAQAAPTRVVIAGVEINGGRALKIEADRPLRVETVGPVKVESDRPLRVENVPYTPGRRPGE